MTSLVTLSKRLQILPENLNQNYKENIEKQLRLELKGECYENLGSFIELVKIKKISNNRIENTSSIVTVKVVYAIIVFLPVLQMTYEGKIIAIFPDGILLELFEVQKFLVPSKTYKPEDIQHLESGATVTVKLTNLFYRDHKFSCVGVLVKSNVE